MFLKEVCSGQQGCLENGHVNVNYDCFGACNLDLHYSRPQGAAI